MVGTLDYIKIMLYNQYGMSLRYKSIEAVHQFVYIIQMQSGSRFVEYKHCRLRLLLREIVGKFNTLVLSSRKR